MTVIERIRAREVLDSRGHPTLEVDVTCPGGFGRAIVPAGASTGRAEAQELRDGDPERYDGRGVLKAVGHVNLHLAQALTGWDARDQAGIDRAMLALDGTPQKTRLGANAILGVSLATARAAAAAQRIPLCDWFRELARRAGMSPASVLADHGRGLRCLPMTNMISGGLHAGGNLDYQDFLATPVGAGSLREGLEWLVRITRRLGDLLAKSGYEGRLVADEGGYGPRLTSNRQALEFLTQAISAAGLNPGTDVTIALDVAATHFHDGSHYRLAAAGDARLTSEEMIDELAALTDEFSVTSIEDGLAEEDWDGWRALTQRLGGRVRLVGDDLFATNEQRLKKGIELQAANAILIKVNQIGTLSETLQTMRLAREHGYACIVSARSGETEDSTIADLAVGAGADQIKIGAVKRGERLAKYNQLLRLEEDSLCR